ncbi:hypothetical protein [Geminocystis sp.]|uniref:hypothetical protein n=1 Tax=Geminocystis sp. TaxID=2664100 RepID=UPI003593A37D
MIFKLITPLKHICFFPTIVITFFISQISLNSFAQTSSNQEIKGVTGGSKNSGDCGYIASQPNYIINLSQQNYSMSVTVETTQGKPTLLVLGPGEGDRYCILGESIKGKYPQMGGVWAPGKYLIYVGDSQGNQNPFTLKISSKK